MSKTLRNSLIGIVAVIAVILLARYVVFAKQFEDWGAGLQRIEDWQTQYKKDYPDATKEEMDAAFEEGIRAIGEWKAQYKRDHPGATDAEADAAFDAAWNK